MRLLIHQPEAGLLIDVASCVKNAVGPQRHPLILRPPRKANALVHETMADAEATCLRLDEEKPKLRDRVGLPNEKHRAHALAVLLCDPASLATRIEVVHELGDDLRD